MNRVVRALLVVAACPTMLVSGLLLTTDPAAAAVPTSPYTALSVDGPADHPDLENGPFVADPSNSTITMVGGHLEAHGASGTGIVDLSPPTGQSWAAGTYDIAAAADATHAGFQVSTGGGVCPTSSGTLHVLQVSMAGNNFTTLAADYSARCGLGSGPAFGVIRWNSAIGYAVGTADPGLIEMGMSFLGRTGPSHVVTVKSLGSQPLTLTDASLTGSSPGEFVVTSDGCAGASLDYGSTCSVAVAARPTLLDGAPKAVLHIPDNSAAGGHDIQLTAFSSDPRNGSYHPMGATRVLDTRIGLGAPKRVVAGGATIHLPLSGVVPVQASVVLNLTVTGPTGAGYVTAFPTGQPRPTTSSINYTRGWTGANLVVVQAGSGTRIDLYNCCGDVHLIADVVGYFLPYAGGPINDTDSYGTFNSVEPERLLDTRNWKAAGLPARYSEPVAVDYGDEPNAAVRALVVTVTAVRPSSGGYLTAYTDGSNPTRSSTLNLQPGVTTPNLAIVPTTICRQDWCAGDPTIWIYNGSSRTQNVLVDIVGVLADDHIDFGARYKPISPTRIVDTRTSLGAAPLGPASTTHITTPSSIVAADTVAAMSNLTAIKPTASPFLTIWPDGPTSTRPTVSNLNPTAGVTVAGAAVAVMGVGNVFNVYNSGGTTNLAVDVSGTFEPFWPATAPDLRAGRLPTAGLAQPSLWTMARPPVSPVATRFR